MQTRTIRCWLWRRDAASSCKPTTIRGSLKTRHFDKPLFPRPWFWWLKYQIFTSSQLETFCWIVRLNMFRPNPQFCFRLIPSRKTPCPNSAGKLCGDQGSGYQNKNPHVCHVYSLLIKYPLSRLFPFSFRFSPVCCVIFGDDFRLFFGVNCIINTRLLAHLLSSRIPYWFYYLSPTPFHRHPIVIYLFSALSHRTEWAVSKILGCRKSRSHGLRLH